MKGTFFSVAVLLLLVVGVHHGALKNGFYWDDRFLIIEGHLVKSWMSIPTIFAHELWYNVDLGERAPEAQIDTYRPLSNVSFLVDRQIWGLNAAGFHLTNLLIHLANVILLFLLLRLLIPPAWAWFGAAVFALHPLGSECIHYVAARTDSLALLFVLLAVWFSFRRQPVNRLDAVWAALCFLAGAMVKETALVFLPFWLLIVVARKEVKTLPVKVAFLMHLASTLIYFGLRLNALGRMKVLNDSAHVAELFLNFPLFVARFFRMVFSPHHNMPMQGFEVLRPPAAISEWLWAGLFYIVCGAAAFYAGKKRAREGIPVAWILLVLAPPFVAVSLTEVHNPRYLYPALAGFAAGLALYLSRSQMSKGALTVTSAVCLVAMSVLTAQTSPKYRTEERFYREILRDHLHHVEAEYNLGNTLARAGRWEEALEMYGEVLRHSPRDASAWNNHGLALLNLNRKEEALRSISGAVKLEPSSSRYVYNLALAYERNRNWLKSAKLYVKLLRQEPDFNDAEKRLIRICENKRNGVPALSEICRPRTP